MLTEFVIANFKGFGKKQRMRLAPITLIYGPNSSGKSSIIQALTLLSRSAARGLARHGLASREGVVDHGGFSSFVHGHDVTRRVELGFTVARSSKELSELHKPRPFSGGSVEVEFGLDPAHRHLDLTRLQAVSYSLGENQPCARFERQEEPWGWTGPLGVFRSTTETSERLAALRLKERLKQQAWRRSAGPPEAAPAEAIEQPDGLAGQEEDVFDWLGYSSSGLDFPDVLWRQDEPGPSAGLRWDRESLDMDGCDMRFEDLAEEGSIVLRRLRYLGPLRSLPARLQPIARQTDRSVGPQGETTLSVLLRHYPVLVPSLNAWLERFNCGYLLDVIQVGDAITGAFAAMKLRDRAGVEVTLADVGFGFSQILPILVEGLVSNDGLIAVEQPEIHLHPRLQGHLADFLVETAVGWIDKSDEEALFEDPDVKMWLKLTEEFPWKRYADEPGGFLFGGLKRREEISDAYGLEAADQDERGRAKVGVRWRGGNQWLIETHSEALVVRLQRHIREGGLKPSDISVLYVDSGLNGCTVRELRLDESGEFIDEWPGGFFEDTFRDLFGGRPR